MSNDTQEHPVTDVLPAIASGPVTSIEDHKKLKKIKPVKRRASHLTRVFGHLMDLKGFRHGTWIISVVYLSENPGVDTLKKVVEERLLTLSRFKSVLKMSSHGGSFIEVNSIDWKYHLEEIFSDRVVTKVELERYIGDLYSRGLDLDKPLWRVTLVPKMEGGGACFFAVINHAIGDGVSLVGVLLNLLDDSPIDPKLPLNAQASHKKKEEIVPELLDADPEAESKKKSGKGNENSFIVAKRKNKPRLPFRNKVGMFLYGIKEGLFGPFGSVDPPNALKIKKWKNFDKTYSGEKVVAQTEQISLDEVKYIKSKINGATVNDVLLAVLTMTVKSFFAEMNDPIVKLKTITGKQRSPLRGNFPVSLRTEKEPILKKNNPSNSWAPLGFRFPFRYSSGVDCLFQVKSQIDKLKVSPQLYVEFVASKLLLNTLPRKFVSNVLLNLNEKVTAMLSNVPGPQTEVHVAGKAIKDLAFYVFSPLGLYLGLISYNNKVSLSINLDASLKIDPYALAKHWMIEFQNLKNEVQQFPGMIPKSKKQRNKILKEAKQSL